LIVNLLNPKAAIVFVVLIPTFAGSSSATVPGIAMLSAIYLIIATLAHSLNVLFAGSFQRFLAEPKREHLVRRAFAVVLAGVAVWLAVSTAQRV
jgi:threonine/homoserine/homoserine lactone efflux protein